ncbi:MAG: tRNA preQ1(34) S-adenosylmethionine ribosyltransferase-isomerase QueA [Bacilli bacterium]|jgi:S-adenosylmethionine:tRNA ribosyltransferase-isomerase|nr:tRNA preQ1(34) S-adenosylmethionine ribosyltransferase-isomerase QueA [Bacilli bacterium]MDD4005855.1 tRNA preQ1(34) S-adenosylmethionine ribosyltransferase-isomerase QueA [Bacilli bacterium]
MDISLFDFPLPEELIAQSPSPIRDKSRLISIDRFSQTYKDEHFFDIVNYLKAGDVLVRNNTKVLPARLFGTKEKTGAHVEVLLLREIEKDIWECLVGNAKVVKVGATIVFKDGVLSALCLETKDEGIRYLKFLYKGVFLEALEEVGLMPLPPYIKKQCDDNSRYQTVYAEHLGSSAAPTAGFHFTPELLAKIKQIGVEIVDITLHIGLGTFRPVKVKDTKDHVMHSEYFEVSLKASQALNKAKSEGRRIIAVGTTSTRTLEAIYQKYGKFVPCQEATDIFISPGYRFVAIDALITNFHLPKSTLIMLVSAFLGREFTMKIYEHAVKEKYRFFSFGDAMFIYGKEN